MARITDLNSLLTVIMRETTLATDSESCSVALYDKATDRLQFCVARGEAQEREFERKLALIRMPMGEGVLGWCAANRLVANIKDAYADPRFNKGADAQTGFRTRSILAVPMVRNDDLIGVVEAVNKRAEGGFSDHDEQVLAVLAAQAALVIENARLVEENVRQARFSAIGQAMAGAAHCIKNILTGIEGGGYVVDVGLRKKDVEQAAKGWEILRRNAAIMKELVLDMLSYARPQKPDMQPVDMNSLCREVATFVAQNARRTNVRMKLSLERDTGPVMADPQAIYRCVLNLVQNAVEACDKDDSLVTVSTRIARFERRLRIMVSDTGCGIAPENREKLFRVFFSTKGVKGTGLGLAVTEKIVSEHGGRMRVESEIGKGSLFVIELPLARPPATGTSSTATIAPSRIPS
jgi:signal transduction histidine kinase